MDARGLGDKIPLDRKRNLKWRRYVVERGAQDVEFRAYIRRACELDPIFFINTFMWTHDPRVGMTRDDTRSAQQPFITYPFQVDAIRLICDCIGHEDVVCEKSRDQGATWCFLIAMLWFWMFQEGKDFALMSRTAEMVDSPSNMNALMPKLDFALRRLPTWLKPRYTYTKMKLVNDENESTFAGYATTADGPRGGRGTAVFMDEHAFFETADGYNAWTSMQKFTNSRLTCSTPNGTGNCFYEVKQRADRGDIKRVYMHWSKHPLQSKGLYKYTGPGELQILDESYKFAPDYEFVLDPEWTTRSPYFDEECRRSGRRSEIAQELQIDYLGSGDPFFSKVEIEKAVNDFARPPLMVLDILRHFDSQVCEIEHFDERSDGKEHGHLALWIALDASLRPPSHREYAIGADISAGTDASNSVLSIGDRATGEKIGQLVTNRVNPMRFGQIAVALARWFCGPRGEGAYLIWEQNGPGRQFEAGVLETGYANFFYKEDEKSILRKRSLVPGWHANPESKRVLLSEYSSALARGDFNNPSEMAIREMGQFQYVSGGKIEHSSASAALDPSGQRDNHGDMVIADALLWRGMQRRPSKAVASKVIPPNCLHRRIEDEKQRVRLSETDWWDPEVVGKDW